MTIYDMYDYSYHLPAMYNNKNSNHLHISIRTCFFKIILNLVILEFSQNYCTTP